MKIKKKGDMNFWLVMLVIALIFMVVMFFVMNKVFTNWGETTEKIQEQTNTELDKNPLFGTDEETETTATPTTQNDQTT
ncbi:MAG: hypothetical protein WC254_02190 [Candidatus Woesearchaeota archaeon]|jgi:uncharacterized protein YpmS